MHYPALIQAIVAGVAFGAVVALVYRWFRRDRPKAAAHAWKIFFALALIVAVRVYFLAVPG